MNRQYRRWLILVLCLCGIAVFPSTRFAQALVDDTNAPAPTIEALARQADLVVVGHVQVVMSTTSTNTFGDELIVSDVTIAIDETLKGVGGSQQIQLPGQIGGTIGDITMGSTDSPLFVQGQRSLIFFEQRPSGLRVLGGALGKFDIDSAENVIGLGLPLAQVKTLIRASTSQNRVYLPLIINGRTLAETLSIATQTTKVTPQFVLTGPRWFGDGRVVPFLINNPGFNDPGAGTIAQQNRAISDAAITWSHQGRANVSEIITGTTSISVVRADAQNVILVRDATDPENPSALATATWRSRGSALTECDIVFWDGSHVFSPLGAIGAFDIQSVATHELGHCLGLDHSLIFGTTMFASAATGETHKRTLHLDDMNGLLEMYGPHFTLLDETPADSFERGDRFGYALAVANLYPGDASREDVVVGAPGENVGTGAGAGAVFLYANSGARYSPPVRLTQAGAGLDEPGDQFGAALATGDFNRDGFVDLVVGAPGEDFEGSGPNAGLGFVFMGGLSGPAAPRLIQQSPASSHQSGDRFGETLVTGDFNGDGFDDLAVGAPGEANAGSIARSGAVFVYLGGATGLGGPRILTQAGAGLDEDGDRFGAALAAGDFNGDGVEDLAVGTPGEDFNGSGAGAGVVFVFAGGATGPGSVRVFDQGPAGRNERNDQFGAALAAGDLDGDGVDDLAIGAPGEDYAGSGANSGVVFTFLGSPSGLGRPTVFGQEFAGANERGDQFGAALATGDFNDDGVDDLAIGAPGEDFEGSGQDAGVVYVRQFGDDAGGNDDLMLVMSQKPAGLNHGGDRYGQALAIGAVSHDLVIGAPKRVQGIISEVGGVAVWK